MEIEGSMNGERSVNLKGTKEKYVYKKSIEVLKRVVIRLERSKIGGNYYDYTYQRTGKRDC